MSVDGVGESWQDRDVPAYWRALGLPGLADIHVHFLPPSVDAKVWSYFDGAEQNYRMAWPVHYRGRRDGAARHRPATGTASDPLLDVRAPTGDGSVAERLVH